MGESVIVEETGRGLFQQDVTVGSHHLTADEPVAAGGLGSGPDPYGLLAASLGTCKVMTMRLYANRKGWALDRIRVSVSHARVHATDCAECEAKNVHMDEFQVAITLAGSLDPAQRARILEIAEHCPVHRTLTGVIRIRTTVADA